MKPKYTPRAYEMVRAAKQLAIKETGNYDLWPVCDCLERVARQRTRGYQGWSEYLRRAGITTTGDVKEILKEV